MGSYLKGDSVYIRATVTKVDADNPNKYTLETKLGRFYANENNDIMTMDPDSNYSVNDFYNMIYFMAARMTTTERKSVFEYEDLIDIFINLTKDDIISKYRQYLINNDTTIGDVVIYVPETDHVSSYTCGVIRITPGSSVEANEYTLYEPYTDSYYIAKRSEIINTGKKSSIGNIIADLANTIKNAAEEN